MDWPGRAGALSAVVFGYMVGYFGNYNAPFVPMVAVLALGAVLWLQVDATRDLFPDERPAESLIGSAVRLTEPSNQGRAPAFPNSL
jgi:hypothetical protein